MQAALVIILLLAILAGAVFVGHYGWVSAGDGRHAGVGLADVGSRRLFFAALVFGQNGRLNSKSRHGLL